MATRDERIAGLESRVAVLEKALAGIPTPTLHAGTPTPAFPPSNPNPRWLNESRFANDCAVERCKTHIRKGERCYFVPKTDTEKSKVYCEPCAKALGL